MRCLPHHSSEVLLEKSDPVFAQEISDHLSSMCQVGYECEETMYLSNKLDPTNGTEGALYELVLRYLPFNFHDKDLGTDGCCGMVWV